MREAAEGGCMVVLLTRDSLDSEVLVNEVAFYLHDMRRSVVPVLCVAHELPDGLAYYLKRMRKLRLSEDPGDDELDKIVETVEKVLLDRFNID